MKILPQAGNNSFSGNALLIFLVRFFPSLANALVIILFSQKLPEHTYGTYQNFWIQLFVLNTVACLGFQAFIITYSQAAVAGILKNIGRKYYGRFSIWLLLCSSVFAGLQYYMNGMEIPVPFLFFIVYALSVIAESVLIAFRNFKWLLAINIVHTLVFLLLHWLFAGSAHSVLWLFLMLLAVAIVRLVLIGIPAITTVQRQPSANDIDMAKAKTLWKHIGVYDVSQMLFKWIDKFVISLLLAEQLSAIYFNGSVDIPFLPLLLGAAGSAALMQMAHAKQGNETQFAIQLMNHSSRLLSCIVFPAFWFLFAYSGELFSVLLSEKYLASVPIFLMSILALPLRAYSFTTVLQNRHKGRIINIGAVLDLLLACTLMYPLYLLMALPGVAFSFVISSYLQAGFYLYHTSKTLNVNIFQLIPVANLLVKLIVFALLFIGIHYLSAIYFTPQIVLFSGMAFAMLASAIALVTEYRAARK